MRSTTEWQLQEAKSRLSELVRDTRRGPQTITLHGKPSVVVISFDDYRKLTEPKMSLVDVMRNAPEGFCDLLLEREQDSALRDIDL
jgi:prevent-host-death family protein